MDTQGLATVSIIQEAGGLDLTSSFDAPLTLSQVLGQVAVFVLLVTVGLYWSGKHGRFLPLIGVGLLGLVLLFSWQLAVFVPNWGVIRSDIPPVVYDPQLTRTFYLSVVGLEAVVIWLVVRRRRKLLNR